MHAVAQAARIYVPARRKLGGFLSDTDEDRLVLVVEEALPRWQVANIAIVLGASIGAHGLVRLGVPAEDAAGRRHEAIAEAPCPVLGASQDQLSNVLDRARDRGLLTLDFNTAARDSRNYDEYLAALHRATPRPLGAIIYGQWRAVRSITDNLRSLQ